MKTYRVIIAEDEFWMRDHIKSILDWKSIGLDLVGEAEDGQEAIHLLEALHPDILITDIRMPYCDGLELLKHIESRGYDTQTIVISGFDDFEYVRSALRYNAVDYLLKPVKDIELLKVLIKAVEALDNKNNEIRHRIKTRQLLQEATSMMIDDAMSLWIDEKAENQLEMQMKMRGMGIPSHFFNYRIVIVRISDWRKLLKKFDYDRSLIVFALKNVLNELFEEYKPLVFYHNSVQGELGIILDNKTEGYTDIQQNALINRLDQFLDIPVFIVESNLVHDASGMQKAWLRTVSKFSNRKLIQKPQWIKNTETIQAPQDNKRLLECVSLCLHNVSNHQTDKAIFAITKLFEYGNEPITIGVFKKHINNILDGIKSQANKNSIDWTENADTLIHTLNERIEACDRDGIITSLRMLFTLVDPPNIDEKHAKTVREMIFDITIFIEHHLSEDLSLAFLADHFNVQPAYLSTLFKEVTGENVTTWISRVRINKAISIFKSTNAKWSDISGMVGYPDYIYFNKVFKKVTGLSPRDFTSTNENVQKISN